MVLAPECSFKWDGAVLAIFLGAIPLAIGVTIATLFLYRWAVGRAMRAAAKEAAPVPEPVPASPPTRLLEIAVVAQSAPLTATPSNLDASIQSMRRLSMAYVLAGLVHVTLATAIMFWLNRLDFSPFRTLAVAAVYTWPVIALLLMTAIVTRRKQALLVGGYFGLLLMLDISLDVFGLRYQPGFGELLILWLIVMGPGLPLLYRPARLVGLVALLACLVLVAAYLVGFQLLGCLVLTTRSEHLLAAMSYLQIAGIVIIGVVAVILLKYQSRRYQAKQISDQMFTLDSWMLLVTAIQILHQMGNSGIASFLFLLAFVGYKLILGLRMRRLGFNTAPGKPQSMLLLRVFGNARRARTLADQVGQTWRHAGPINTIGGTDMATALLDLEELMAFWSGKLRQSFVASAADLENRIQSLDEKRDPDGRYRINEFFCHDNTWRATVHALAQHSAVVLMDLRGFGRENRGCEFELAMLLCDVPLARVVLLADRTTCTEELKTLLDSVWGSLPASSPNRDLAEPVLHLFHVENSSKALRPLLSRLFAAAT